MRLLKESIFLVFFSVLLLFSSLEGGAWQEDLLAAKRTAEKEGRPLLVAALGGAESPWSEKFDEDVLSRSEFIQAVTKDCVFVKLRSEGPAQKEEMRKNLGLTEWPMLLLYTKEGQEIVKEGFFPHSAREYADHIKESIFAYLEIENEILEGAEGNGDKLEQLYKKARRYGFYACQEAIMQKGLAFSKNPYFFMEKYESLIFHRKRKDPELLALRKKILSLDPKNGKGMHLRLAMVDFTLFSSKEKKKRNPSDVVAPLVTYLKKFGDRDSENVWKIEMTIAQFLFSKSKFKSAVKHAKRALASAPELIRPEIESTLNYMMQHLD